MRMIFVIGTLILLFFVMPNIIAKYSLQHKFISGEDVDCIQCHPTEYSELTSSDAQASHMQHVFFRDPYPPIDYSRPCKACHIPFYGSITFQDPTSPYYKTSYYNPYGGGTASYHAAALVECTFCHERCSACHRSPPKANVTAEFENSTIEAHRPLYFRAKNASGLDTNDILAGANEACIACHTHAVNVTIVQPTKYLNVAAYYSGTGPYSGWLINFSSNS